MTSTVIRTQRSANATGECYTFSLHQRLQHIVEPQMFWVALSVIPGMGEFVCLPSQGNSQCHLKNYMQDKKTEIQETASRRISRAVSPRSSQQWGGQDTLIPSTHCERGRSRRFNLCCLHLPLPHVYNTDNTRDFKNICIL